MRKDKPRDSILIDYILGPLLALVVGSLLYQGLSVLFATLWPKLKLLLDLRGVTLVGTIVILLLGAVLFYFKKHYQKLYGLAEIGFALAVSWSSMMRTQSMSDATSWITVLAAGYLVVRGMSNFDEGRKRMAPR